MADDELPFRYVPPPDPNLGRRVDTYFILRIMLGKGGMGAAYLAEHEALAHIKCVIKLVLVEMTRHPMIISRYHNEAKALALLRHDNIVKLHGLAEPGTTLTSTTNGIILEVRGSSQVTIADLTISGASGPAGTGLGISLPPGNSASLTLSRVAVTGNQGGGISISGGQFDITNSVIAGNGGAQTSFGGVHFDQIDNGTRRFEFNTIADNVAKDGTSVGVVCTLVTQPVTFSNSIVYENQIGGTRTQVGGANCNWTYSDIGPDTVSGTGNINADPLFVDPAQNNFHVQPTSPVKDKADPGAAVHVDIDGNTRPQGSGYDMGADEIQ